MKNKYKDLIEQTFDFPQDEFTVEDNELNFHDIPLMELIKQYGTPLKITYLPKISQQINRAKRMFNVAMAKAEYELGFAPKFDTVIVNDDLETAKAEALKVISQFLNE